MHFCRKIFSCPEYARQSALLRAAEAQMDETDAKDLDAYVRACNHLYVFCRGSDWRKCPALNDER